MIKKIYILLLSCMAMLTLSFGTQYINVSHYEGVSDYFDSQREYAQTFHVNANNQELKNVTLSLWRDTDVNGFIALKVLSDLQTSTEICIAIYPVNVFSINEGYFTDNKYTFNFNNCILDEGNYSLNVISIGVVPYNVYINHKQYSTYNEGKKYYRNTPLDVWTEYNSGEDYDLLFDMYLEDYVAPPIEPQCQDNTLFDSGYGYIMYNSTPNNYSLDINGGNTYYLGSLNNFIEFEIDDTYWYYFRVGSPTQNYGYCVDLGDGSSVQATYYYNTKFENEFPFPYHVGSIWRSSFYLDTSQVESIDYNYLNNPNATVYFYTYHTDGDNGKNYAIKRQVTITTYQPQNENNIDLFSGLRGFSEVGTETGGFFSGLFLGGLIIVFFALISLSFIVFMLWKIANAISKAIPNLKNKKK